ncbi:MAG: cytochrome c [Gemmatimonadota bacterium]|nr:cytochrome c [Gemmatimonadota bacterium]
MRRSTRGTVTATCVGFLLIVPAALAAQSGAELYDLGCASCHGADGAGATSDAFAFDDPLPDFTDCSFASREPDGDWVIVAKAGGPIRGFSESMPAYGEAFSDEQLESILAHIRTFCTNHAWPRGELNLPRPLVTEKAYPEDELVWETRVNTDGLGAVVNQFVYEKRFGPRGQLEVTVPFGFADQPAPMPVNGASAEGGAWEGGLGDVAVGWKHAVWHNDASIFSLTGEVLLPTAGSDSRLGNGVFAVEPFATFGQVLPADAFAHFQAGTEIPLDTDDGRVHTEWFWRAVLGKTWTSGEFGRAWSPMVELLGAHEVEDGAGVDWDLVPQIQITLNARQHIMLNLGVQLPLNDTDERPTRFMFYFLWDWFDGGLFDGW